MKENTVKKETLKVEKKSNSRSTIERINNTLTDELIIGLCSPIGSLKKDVLKLLIERLNEYNYTYQVIKLSDFILKHYSTKPTLIPGKSETYTELLHKIQGGNFLRKKFDSNSILVELAINKIREERDIVKPTEAKSRRICYIIDSIKNLKELELLRIIYKDIFYLFSIFTPLNERLNNLQEKGINKFEALDLINKDEHEDILHGQDVRNTFVEGDFFIRISKSNKEAVRKNIIRYFHLIFETKIITPNKHETAMYYAKSAAGNSACLSRQVGATITDKEGIILSRGWNDVPKFGGNLYTEGDINDQRCSVYGKCSNVTHRNEIFENIEKQFNEKVKSLIDNKIIEEKNKDKILDFIEIVKKSNFKNVIEYSRSIHAEMHAIIIGSQKTGDKMIGGNLYCTTYPCHNCARHIILAGIKNVYYIEPYTKSLGIKLHKDALTEDENDDSKVRILHYEGVAPRRYLDLFTSNERKNKIGEMIKRPIKKAKPKQRISLQAIPTLEGQVVVQLKQYGILE